LSLIESNPKVILVMPYFLHRGIHIKSDVTNELTKVIKKYHFSNIYISDHIGVDKKIIELVLDRTTESENRRIVKKW
jgi:precorrin-8X/cobalt-precorrin-8 methylmutase